MIQGFGSIAYYLAKAELYTYRNKSFPRSVRNQYIMNWGANLLRHLSVKVKVTGCRPTQEAAILVGNHVSYLDIPLVCSQVPGLFVAKAELSRWPILGRAGRFLDTVLVERESSQSRFRTAMKITEKVLKERERLVIFPSGTTSMHSETRWRQGVFKIAKKHNLPIQPFRLTYTPLREAAFIDNDLFIPHFLKLSRIKNIEARIEFGVKRNIMSVEDDTKELQAWCNHFNT